MIRKRNKQRRYYNRGTKDLPPLKKGDIVRVEQLPTDNQERWLTATTERKADIRSYVVQTEEGQRYRRNRRHLRGTKEPFDGSVMGEDHAQEDTPEEAKE